MTQRLGKQWEFFKNPVVAEYQEFKELLLQFPNIPHYPVSEQEIKIPANLTPLKQQDLRAKILETMVFTKIKL